MNKKNVWVVISVLLISCCVFAVSPVMELAQKMPDNTIAIMASSGLDDFEDDFKQTPLGQICYDEQVEEFVQQIISAVSQKVSPTGQWLDEDLKALINEVLRSPVMLGVSLDPDLDACDPFSGYLICKDPSGQNKIANLYAGLIEEELKEQTIVKKRLQDYSVYVSNDPNVAEVNYAGQVGNYFIASFNDANYTLLTHLSKGTSNLQLSQDVSNVKDTQDAFVWFINFKRVLSILQDDSEDDKSFQQFMGILNQLGLSDLESFLCCGGFEDQQITGYTELKVPTDKGIWKCFQPADRRMFTIADKKAIRAGVMHFDVAALYDQILTIVEQNVPADPNGGVSDKIASFEEKLGFKIRKQLLGSLEGSFMCYNIGAADLPGIPNGGVALTAKLKDPEAMQQSLKQLGNFVQAVSQGKMTVSSQKIASGKEVNIWSMNSAMMMFFIPSWAIEGDTLVISIHPIMTGHVLDQIASADVNKSMLARSEFDALLKTVPSDAFSIALMDSQSQGRQVMMAIQQIWPMARMMASQQGINLPMMIPSLDSYIAQMKPGLCYGRKTASGLQWRYKGSGMEITSGGVAVAAGTVAILMPALNKTKKIAQRVVSGTNLKGIGAASIVYANDHDGQFPTDFDQLVAECDVSPKSLESPRKPKSFDGPSYILIPGLTDAAPYDIVLAYENPDFCEDKVNVLFVDGRAAAVSKQQLDQDLQRTTEYLNQLKP